MSISTTFRKLLVPFTCALTSAFPVFSFAELRALENEEMQDIRGQAGLTIDIETKYTIAEFEYVDAGSIFMRDLAFEGIDGGLVDNIRATVDISGPNERLAMGFSDYALWAAMGFLDPTEEDVEWALSEYADASTGTIGKEVGDGDLLIHVGATDYGLIDFTATSPVRDSAEYAENLDKMKNAIDFKMVQGEFGIRSSDGDVETVLTSNLSIEAYLGYVDILIKNNGNGFSQTDEVGEPDGIRLGDSHIYIDTKFRVEDLDVDSTNNVQNPAVPQQAKNPYLTIRDMRIHNERGADTLGYFGFASVEKKIAAAKDIIPQYDSLIQDASAGTLTSIQDIGSDGISIYDINIRWDWDLPHIQFGDTNQTIGEVYFTDFVIGTSLTISAH